MTSQYNHHPGCATCVALVSALDRLVRTNGYAPSVAELAAEAELSSTSVVMYHVVNMEERGYIRRPEAVLGRRVARAMAVTPAGRAFVRRFRAA